MIKMFKTWGGVYNCNISKLSIMYSVEVCRLLGKFCVDTASQGCPCYHVYSKIEYIIDNFEMLQL